MYKNSQKPQTTSPEVNERGLCRLRKNVALIARSSFGKNQRGSILTQKALHLIEQNRVSFSPDLEHQSICWRQFLRSPHIYIALSRSSDKKVSIPDNKTITQALFHETVHVIHNTGCLEEECDAYIAAAQAIAAINNEELVFPVTIGGESVWPWVIRIYSDRCRSNKRYQPVEETREWLRIAAGG